MDLVCSPSKRYFLLNSISKLTLHRCLKECVNIKGFIGNFSHLTLDYGQLIMLFYFFYFSTRQIYLNRVCDYSNLVNRRNKVRKH